MYLRIEFYNLRYFAHAGNAAVPDKIIDIING